MKRLVIVTGASRGIGRAIANELNRIYAAGDTLFLLLARDATKLTEAKNQIETDSQGRNTAKTLSVDFASPLNKVDQYFQLLSNGLNNAGTQELDRFEELVVIYNHGTLVFGSVPLVAQNQLREDFEVNLFSIWSLLAAINLLLPLNEVSRQFHINISSSYACEAAANWSGHCCGNFLIFFYSHVRGDIFSFSFSLNSENFSRHAFQMLCT